MDRGRRVVVRSPRGVELAEIVSPLEKGGVTTATRSPDRTAYRILRPTNGSDERLIERLDRYKQEAILACRDQLSDAGSKTTLLDVDQLLDGGTLVMHFLGQPDPPAQQIADRIAAKYESIVRTHHLSELLTEGCGPGCGTAAGAGCEGSCAGCSGCGS